MILPLMGLLMVGIPVAGIASALLLVFVKRARFLAPFAMLVPAAGSYGAIFGFWTIAVALSEMGASDRVSGFWGLLMSLIGGLLGIWGACKVASRFVVISSA